MHAASGAVLKRSTLWLAVALLGAPILLPGAPAQAGQKLNLLVMGQDADAASPGGDLVTVARDTRVFNGVLEALIQQLGQNQFAVYDERSITLDGFRQDRVGRSEAELLDIARSVQRPPIDAVVIFTIQAGARRLTYTTEIQERITARIVHVRTGQRLGSFEVASPKGWRAPVGCERDCLVEAIGKSAGMMAGDLGGLVARKLAATLAIAKEEAPRRAGAVKEPGYTLRFSGFADDELSGAQEYLVAFDGYRQHRQLPSSGQDAAYRYEGDADATRLLRHLRMMLARLGVEASVSYAAADGTFTLKRQTPSVAAH